MIRASVNSIAQSARNVNASNETGITLCKKVFNFAGKIKTQASEARTSSDGGEGPCPVEAFAHFLISF